MGLISKNKENKEAFFKMLESGILTNDKEAVAFIKNTFDTGVFIEHFERFVAIQYWVDELIEETHKMMNLVAKVNAKGNNNE